MTSVARFDALVCALAAGAAGAAAQGAFGDHETRR